MPADVAIVGAGPAGATAALLLARAGLNVQLVDQTEFPRDKACGDLVGTYAIATLRRLAIRLKCIESSPPLRGAFVFAPTGKRIGATIGAATAARLGACVIPRLSFDAELVAEAIAAGATFVKARVTAVEQADDGSVNGVRTADGRLIRASITIGADGWSSVVSRAVVSTPRAPNEAGIAVRTYVDKIAATPGMRFFIGAPTQGYGWIFPLPGGGANVGLGFIRDEPGAGNLHAAFDRFLARPELNGAIERGPRRTWPIPFGWRGTPASSAGVLLAGDAASLASSLSGSGIHTAIASGALAARVARDAIASKDVSARRLAVYDRRLRPIAMRLALERRIHSVAGTPAGSARAIELAQYLPGAGRLAVGWLLNLG